MSDFFFRFPRVPVDDAARVSRYAALEPLFGSARTDEAVVRKTMATLFLWRARIHELAAIGIGRFNAQRLTYTRNCCPTFAVPSPLTRRCGLASICPFCYARVVQQVWGAVYASLHLPPKIVAAPGFTFPFWLVERYWRQQESCPETVTEIEFLANKMRFVVDRRKDNYKRFSAVGAYVTTTFEPLLGREWLIKTRQLLKVPAGTVLPAEQQGEKILCHERPARPVLMGAVARVCRYPRRLLRGDAARTALFLNVKAAVQYGKRLSAMFGDFREGRAAALPAPSGDVALKDVPLALLLRELRARLGPVLGQLQHDAPVLPIT